MANRMRVLIQRKYYSTLEEVVARLNSFMMWEQITPQEYDELMMIAEETYNPILPLPLEPSIPQEEITQ